MTEKKQKQVPSQVAAPSSTADDDKLVPDNIPIEGTIELRVRYQETDQMGIVHHGNYFTWFEMGRTELLRQVAGISYREFENSETLLAIVKAECSYKRPAKYDDLLVLKTRLGKVTRVQIEHHYELYRGFELLAVGRTVLAAVDRKGRITTIPLWFGGKKIADMAIAKAKRTMPVVPHCTNVLRVPRSGAPAGKDFWSSVEPLSDFHLYWNRKESEQNTELRMTHDGRYLYFRFDVQDNNVIIANEYKTKEDVLSEDRVEFFFDTGDDMARYYALEMDPLGRVLDYQASFYRQYDRNWSWPGLEIRGQVVDGGYRVEGRLALDTLRSLDILKADNTMRVGCFRAVFRRGIDGKIVQRWMSWIHPGTIEPDFHVPSALGTVRLL